MVEPKKPIWLFLVSLAKDTILGPSNEQAVGRHLIISGQRAYKDKET